MKNILILIILFVSFPLFAEEVDIHPQKVKKNITYSPLSYNNFTGSIAGLDHDYGWKEQLCDIPVKRVSMEFLYRTIAQNPYWDIIQHFYWGFVISFSHNRIDTGINPIGNPEYEKKETSLTSINIGFTSMEALRFISNNLFLKLAIGISGLDIWREELKDNKSAAGKFIEIGLRYIFPSDSLYNINLGIDFSFADSFLSAGQGNYRAIGMLGVYPYIGYMW